MCFTYTVKNIKMYSHVLQPIISYTAFIKKISRKLNNKIYSVYLYYNIVYILKIPPEIYAPLNK